MSTYQIEDFDSIESEPRDAILNIGLDNAHNIQEHRVVDLKKYHLGLFRPINCPAKSSDKEILFSRPYKFLEIFILLLIATKNNFFEGLFLPSKGLAGKIIM